MRKFKAKRNRTIFRSNTFLLLNIFFFFLDCFWRGVLCVFCVFLDSLAGFGELRKAQIMRENGKVIEWEMKR